MWKLPRFSSELALTVMTATSSGGPPLAVGENISRQHARRDLLGRPPKLLPSPDRSTHAIYAGPFLPGSDYLFQRGTFFVSRPWLADEASSTNSSRSPSTFGEVAFLNYTMIGHLSTMRTRRSTPICGPLRLLRQPRVLHRARGEARFCLVQAGVAFGDDEHRAGAAGRRAPRCSRGARGRRAAAVSPHDDQVGAAARARATISVVRRVRPSIALSQGTPARAPGPLAASPSAARFSAGPMSIGSEATSIGGGSG